MWQLYVGLLPSVMFSPSHKAAMLMGARRDGEMGVRQQAEARRKPEDKRWIAWDDKGTGFGVRVHPSGAKSTPISYNF